MCVWIVVFEVLLAVYEVSDDDGVLMWGVYECDVFVGEQVDSVLVWEVFLR